MRIVQLSDIHLSESNLEDLKNYFLDALIDDLTAFNTGKKIDIILLSGDLLDKGGDSLGGNGYEVFQTEFLTPIERALSISRTNVLFVPGNHDINRQFIETENEFWLKNNLTKEIANKKLKENLEKFSSTNKRIEKFKNFEKQYHADNPQYIYSNNESLFITESHGKKVGFALINDSWRCSLDLKKECHFIGTSQLFHASKHFRENKTDLNIAVFHHPLDAFNNAESDDIENILKSCDFDIAIFGHSHEHKFESIVSTNGGILLLNGRAAFNKADEMSSKYQPGYNVLDINLETKQYEVFARKFIRNNGFRFDKDVDSVKDGFFSGQIDKDGRYIDLTTKDKRANESSTANIELPNGYSADVNRIVKLLIGKSLYPNPFIFVRELIQNSVDACNRVKLLGSSLNPKIVVKINTDENYFEISDEGDGMTKQVLRDHFSIIGKSISQDSDIANGNLNLISQFGIGFISTFIVAQKIYISTKSQNDETVIFEITDVFKGFNYDSLGAQLQNKDAKTGTVIRVYLKTEYSSANIFNYAKNYCRHIENLKFYVDNTQQSYPESWNIEGGDFFYSQRNTKYELKLTLGNNPRHIISSNSGFFINNYAPQLIPFKFPFHIGGEVNFFPRSIDFDLSRSNIIETDKSIEFRKDLSVSLRQLFRQALESGNRIVRHTVVSYLQFYLCVYDSFRQSFSDNYIDFYSKKELIDLCIEYSTFNYLNYLRPLSDILLELKNRNINAIYLQIRNQADDYQSFINSYLSEKGNLIIQPTPINAFFRDGQQQVNTQMLIQIIANELGLAILDTNVIQPNDIKDIKIPRDSLPITISQQLTQIEENFSIVINIASFNRNSKPTIKYREEYFINYEHPTFHSLLSKVNQLSNETIRTYFIGLLGLHLQ